MNESDKDKKLALLQKDAQLFSEISEKEQIAAILRDPSLADRVDEYVKECAFFDAENDDQRLALLVQD